MSEQVARRRVGGETFGQFETAPPPVAEGRHRVPDEEAPKPGDRVFYKHWSWEWIPATVVSGVAAEDNDGNPARYGPPKRGCLHLRIELVPERHFSASDFGYRQNVEEGTDEGQWQRVPPQGWEAQKEARAQRMAMERDVRLATWAAQSGEHLT